jgi:hypothetical protein
MNIMSIEARVIFLNFPLSTVTTSRRLTLDKTGFVWSGLSIVKSFIKRNINQ